MTINVVLSTSEAIILGCDSLSSVTESVFRPDLSGLAKGEDGKPIQDSNGNLCIPLGQVKSSVTNVFGGVKKMFSIYESHDASFQVAAITSGLAILEGITIAEHAKGFQRHVKKENISIKSVKQAAQEFTAFVRTSWETTVGFSTAEEEDLPRTYPALHFLIAGFEPSGPGMIYRVQIEEDEPKDRVKLEDDGKGALSWAGQANYVERLIYGSDGLLRKHANEVIDHVQKGTQFDPNFWSQNCVEIDYTNLPTQYAVEFVEMLVNVQSGMQRFVPGIATVGGRTHIGVLQRGEGFKMLNEPELRHPHTGYGHDL